MPSNEPNQLCAVTLPKQNVPPALSRDKFIFTKLKMKKTKPTNQPS